MRLIGVNAVGAEGQNALMTAGRTLPWLQDVAGVDAWGTWEAETDDMFVLDPDNRYVEAYNLHSFDLSTAGNRDALKALLRDLATP